jgi:hypothetical protein
MAQLSLLINTHPVTKNKNNPKTLPVLPESPQSEKDQISLPEHSFLLKWLNKCKTKYMKSSTPLSA